MTTTTPATETHARGRAGLVIALVIGLVIVPVAVAFVALWGADWKPASDIAVEVLRVRDVGGRHTPFTGVQSRFGWDHPGPMLFWYLAPWYRLFGTTGVMYAVGALNIAALVGALVVARRRGGVLLMALVGIVALLLVRSLTLDLLVDPWNPWVAVLPFLLFVLLAWSVAERDRGALVWLVAVGTFLVQTHVGYALLFVGAGAAA
ncbi:MAG TPA: hypothetical protein VFX21_03900, partial [Acidimicrobiia bacterium]|nr:hypothetical protein [Acidimicrobiia bacterium]